jgi:hypothetical protein
VEHSLTNWMVVMVLEVVKKAALAAGVVAMIP